MKKRSLVWLGLGVGVAWGCGPFIEAMRLEKARVVLDVPLATFSEALGEVDGGGRAESSFDSRDGRADEAVAGELRAALVASGVAEGEVDGLVAGVIRVREAVGSGVWPLRWRRGKDFKIEKKIDVVAVLGDPVFGSLPEAMGQYLRGAVCYRAGEFDAAVAAWMQVLALPEAERRERGAWAAWMVGREQADLAAAVPYFERVIGEVGLAGRDPLHLEAAATGMLARAAFDAGDRVAAARLYYDQHLAGDDSGELSLRKILPGKGADVDDAELKRMIADPVVRRLVTARLLGNHGARPYYSDFEEEPRDVFAERWLAAAEATEVDLGVEGERLAWLAYGVGDFKRAERWLRVSGESPGPVGRWLEAKLWLQRGDVLTAADILSELVREIDRPWSGAKVHLNEWDNLQSAHGEEVDAQQVSQLLADAGILSVAKAEMGDALWLFLKSGYWEDAAYVAERLMDTEALVAFVDERFPEGTGGSLERKSPEEKLDEVSRSWWGEEAAPVTLIRSLLARRLAREGKLGEAIGYYPDGLKEIARYFKSQLEAGRNEALPDRERADALWEAAQVMRAFGMELRGTEGTPDAFVYGGALRATPVESIRSGRVEEEWLRWDEEPVPKVGAVERLMLESNPAPERRFHYRWEAAQLAWEAASLMPGDREETAWLLHIAGSWIRIPDPQGADRFYKSMIWRNWETPLARETDLRRWFLFESGWNQRDYQMRLVKQLLEG